LFATSNIDGALQEVVVATSQDIFRSGFDGIGEAGVYVVGTGATGVTETLGILGIGYGLSMAAMSFLYKLPPKNYIPPNVSTTEAVGDKVQESSNLTLHNVDTDVATRTPQFWLMYGAFGLSITGAYGFLSCGKLILTETFSSLDVVTPSFTTAFVAGMSAANLSGRIIYTNLSDLMAKKMGGDPFYGRRLSYTLMFGAAAPAYMAVIWSVHQNDGTSVLPLVVFSGSVFTILSSFGGSAATRPAIVGDLFGLKNVAPLSARQLSVVLPGAFAGPKAVTSFRESSVNDAIYRLSENINNDAFESAFGLGKEHLNTLIEQKTVTVPRLMEIAPPGTIDPSPFVYDTSMYLMCGLTGLALLTNQLIKPVSKELYSNTKA